VTVYNAVALVNWLNDLNIQLLFEKMAELQRLSMRFEFAMLSSPVAISSFYVDRADRWRPAWQDLSL